MEKDTLYWLTDRTPHEALPNESGEAVYRQFFRLVTAEVSVWFQDHSTPNPNGVVPDPKITQIIKGSKFKETVVIKMSRDDTEDDSESNESATEGNTDDDGSDS